jgi:hypothetical protein
MLGTSDPRYDSIGHGYGSTRREDPRIAARIRHGLGEARTTSSPCRRAPQSVSPPSCWRSTCLLGAP